MKARLLLSAAMLMLMLAAGCANKPADSGATTTPGATTPATTPSTTNTPPSAPATSDGTKYAVVAAESTASYSVGETFLGQNRDNTAVGKTSEIKGEIVLKDGVIQPSTVTVDLSTLKTDEERRDNKVREALNTDTHPLATFAITGAEGSPVLKDGEEVSFKLVGKLTINGTEQPASFDTKGKLQGDSLTLTSTTTFDMNTYGVKPPSIGGFVSVQDNVTLNISYVGKKQ